MEDPRHPSYITYSGHVLLMTSFLLYFTSWQPFRAVLLRRMATKLPPISSMRKTREEFNSDVVIENIAFLCKEPDLKELPYWETINNYLKKLEPKQLQEVIWDLVRHLLRCRAFENARIRGKYWQIIIDGTQIASSRKGLEKNRQTEKTGEEREMV